MQWFEETKFFPDWSPCFGTIQIKGTKRWAFFDDQAKKFVLKVNGIQFEYGNQTIAFNGNAYFKPNGRVHTQWPNEIDLWYRFNETSPPKRHKIN